VIFLFFLIVINYNNAYIRPAYIIKMPESKGKPEEVIEETYMRSADLEALCSYLPDPSEVIVIPIGFDFYGSSSAQIVESLPEQAKEGLILLPQSAKLLFGYSASGFSRTLPTTRTVISLYAHALSQMKAAERKSFWDLPIAKRRSLRPDRIKWHSIGDCSVEITTSPARIEVSYRNKEPELITALRREAEKRGVPYNLKLNTAYAGFSPLPPD